MGALTTYSMGEYYGSNDQTWENNAHKAIRALRKLDGGYAGEIRTDSIELWILANERGKEVTATYWEAIDRINSAQEGQSGLN